MLVAILASVIALIGLTAWGIVTVLRHIDCAIANLCGCIGDHDPEPDPVATSPEPTPVVVQLPVPHEHREAA